jgi:metal-responsive CopG/Arc/MetJ family transcriptional regulator
MGNKQALSFSITKSTLEKFVEYCNGKSLNRSAVVNQLIEQYLKDKENN